MLKKNTGLKTCYGNFENFISKFRINSKDMSKQVFVNGSVFNVIVPSDKVLFINLY